MTKRWSSTASMDGKTKRQASKEARRDGSPDLTAAALDLVLDDLLRPVSDIAEMRPTNAWPVEIRNLIGLARSVAKKYGFECVKGPAPADLRNGGQSPGEKT